MVKISNVFGTKFSGKIGKNMVAASWKGHEYVRAFAKPSNPNTEQQQQARGQFADAVEAWQKMSKVQCMFYNAIALRMSGFNLFISRYMNAVRAKEEPEIPWPMKWKTEDGQPVLIGQLVVRHGERQVFNVSLKKGIAEVALTPSDSPYTFVLKRGDAEEAVMTTRDLTETGFPPRLESEELGIVLVADVPTPPT